MIRVTYHEEPHPAYDDGRILRTRIGHCECGDTLALTAFTNTCDCGRDYNSAGQMLAPREQWGEETGEHWTECY